MPTIAPLQGAIRDVLPRIITCSSLPTLAAWMRVDSFCHDTAARHVYRELRIHDYCPRYLFYGLGLDVESNLHPLLQPASKDESGHSAQQNHHDGSAKVQHQKNDVGSEELQDSKDTPARKRLSKADLLALTEILEVGPHVCDFQIAVQGVKAFTNLSTVRLFYPHCEIPPIPRGCDQVFCLPWGTGDASEASLLALAQATCDSESNTVKELDPKEGKHSDMDSTLRRLLLSRLVGNSDDHQTASDETTHNWNIHARDPDVPRVRMSVNAGQPVQYPCPFLWNLAPAKVVLYPLGVDQLIDDDLAMIARRAHEFTLVLPPNRSQDFWLKINRRPIARLLSQTKAAARLRIVRGGWTQRVCDIFKMRKGCTVRFSLDDIVGIVELFDDTRLTVPVEVYILNDSWTPCADTFPVNTVEEVDAFARELAEIMQARTARHESKEQEAMRSPFILFSKREYVRSGVRGEVDATCLERWMEDVRAEDEAMVRLSGTTRAETHLCADANAGTGMCLERSVRSHARADVDHEGVLRESRSAEWNVDNRIHVSREAERHERFADFTSGPCYVGIDH